MAQSISWVQPADTLAPLPQEEPTALKAVELFWVGQAVKLQVPWSTRPIYTYIRALVWCDPLAAQVYPDRPNSSVQYCKLEWLTPME